MILDILLGFLLQILFTIGLIVLVGFLIALCNKKFYSNLGGLGMTACYVTGCIGTPIHELSHALFCLIFGHKITEIKLFQINSDDGTLGYVKHSYNSKNIYQRIGNFFIGVAPILVISALLYLIAWLLMPKFVVELSILSASVNYADFGDVFGYVWAIIQTFFAGIITWQWWVFVVIGIFHALHMTLSGADIKGALSGLVFLLIALLVVDVIIGLISQSALNAFTRFIISAGSGLLCFLMLALIISVIAVAASFIVKLKFKR